ncbi:cytochrome c1 [Chitinilyticum piscinae]|uniref:Cytochrome c1 n=1 Tax=Chitinilyticum piscinae TaxID=2866724 RepID=A0A8J7FP94_9NEIS|nr:cytochrome c1 [Chitinilyticum piscinae]MBE9610546.1 cytochrome c1 [Chitinilyticum piscinae]
MKNMTSKLLLALCAVIAAPVFAAGGEGVKLDPANINLRDTESLQRGAQTFVNYCLSCHGAAVMRYNRLQDIGLTEAQIRDNLMFAGEKVGDTMKVAMAAKDGKAWFGATPPDLSLIARSRGADWLYSYLRGFYRDDSRPTGWNNRVFDKVGMPHVLWELQGDQVPVFEKVKNHSTGKEEEVLTGLKLVKAGSLTTTNDKGELDNHEYDARVRDLVNYMVFMSEPVKVKNEQIGYFVLLFLLFVLVPISYLLKKEYWKDVH